MRRFESCRGHGPVLRTNLCGAIGLVAIVEGEGHVDGVLARLVGNVELELLEQRPQFALGRLSEPVGEDG
ncbi:MAG: hypothetical protein ACYCO3_06235 [Mycobacteriales bacterium]